MAHDIPPSAVERFWAKVDKREPTECWPWTAFIHPQGYGRFGLRDGQIHNAHRVALTLAQGETVPSGVDVDHLCRNRACCNPTHLEATSHRENVLRGEGPSAVNAAKTHCIHGHAFDDGNTYVYRGNRFCRTCRRNRKVSA